VFHTRKRTTQLRRLDILLLLRQGRNKQNRPGHFIIFRTKALLAKQKRPIYPLPSAITSPFDPGGWSAAISAFYSKQNSSDCGVQLRELL
jgi:hypothetical protein